MIEAGGTLADPRVRVRIEVETDEVGGAWLLQLGLGRCRAGEGNGRI